jgi:hypothetical protein
MKRRDDDDMSRVIVPQRRKRVDEPVQHRIAQRVLSRGIIEGDDGHSIRIEADANQRAGRACFLGFHHRLTRPEFEASAADASTAAGTSTRPGTSSSSVCPTPLETVDTHINTPAALRSAQPELFIAH